MSVHTKSVVAEHEAHQLTYGKYVVGFVSSVALTLLAYVLVTQHSLGTNVIVGLISVLAFIQFVVQMVFFLHLGEERKPRWKLLVAVFMVGVVLIVIGGSIWIMNNLNYRMTPQQMEQYLKSQDAL